MIFTADITTEVGRDFDNPLKTLLKITTGLIYKVEVEFPTGPCGLLYTSCFDGYIQFGLPVIMSGFIQMA